MNLAQHILILLVRLYRLTLSPLQGFLFGPLARCRFTPTCSQYALESIQTHGALAGSWLALKRICRCNPWGGSGDDPVPIPGKRRSEGPGRSSGFLTCATADFRIRCSEEETSRARTLSCAPPTGKPAIGQVRNPALQQATH